MQAVSVELERKVQACSYALSAPPHSSPHAQHTASASKTAAAASENDIATAAHLLTPSSGHMSPALKSVNASLGSSRAAPAAIAAAAAALADRDAPHRLVPTPMVHGSKLARRTGSSNSVPDTLEALAAADLMMQSSVLSATGSGGGGGLLVHGGALNDSPLAAAATAGTERTNDMSRMSVAGQTNASMATDAQAAEAVSFSSLSVRLDVLYDDIVAKVIVFVLSVGVGFGLCARCCFLFDTLLCCC